MNYEDELKKLKRDLENAKNLKNKADGTLEELKKQEEKQLDELKNLGVDPQNLETEIKNLEAEIQKLFNEANELLPKDLLERANERKS